MREDFLNEEQRAEDILLGALGYGEDAHIVSVERTADGFRGDGRYGDGEAFSFSSDFELDDLDRWALDILTGKRS